MKSVNILLYIIEDKQNIIKDLTVDTNNFWTVFKI